MEKKFDGYTYFRGILISDLDVRPDPDTNLPIPDQDQKKNSFLQKEHKVGRNIIIEDTADNTFRRPV